MIIKNKKAIKIFPIDIGIFGTLRIPYGVQEIGEYALKGSYSKVSYSLLRPRENIKARRLRRIKFSRTLKEISHGAFSCSKQLHTLEIPEGLEVINGNPFVGCNISRVTMYDASGKKYKININSSDFNSIYKEKDLPLVIKLNTESGNIGYNYIIYQDKKAHYIEPSKIEGSYEIWLNHSRDEKPYGFLRELLTKSLSKQLLGFSQDNELGEKLC